MGLETQTSKQGVPLGCSCYCERPEYNKQVLSLGKWLTDSTAAPGTNYCCQVL